MTPELEAIWRELCPECGDYMPGTMEELLAHIKHDRKLLEQTRKLAHYAAKMADCFADNLLVPSKVGQLRYCCPVCGDTYMHVQRVKALKCGDESGDGSIEGIDLDAIEDGQGWRRPGIAIEIDGESCGHRFRLRIQQHKGEIFIFTEVMQWRETSLDSDVSINAEALAILEDPNS